MTKPINHLCRFEEMLCSAKALPAGNMPVPNDALKIEWFYMSFRQEDRTRYLESGRRLCNKTLATVTEYFDNIFNLQMADGSLTKKGENQSEFRAKSELRRLVFILAGSLFYGTVTFRKKTRVLKYW